MNIIFNGDIKATHRSEIQLVFPSERRFNDFIQAILMKKDWIEELCCCYYMEEENRYDFETDEGDRFVMPYDDFAEYVKLATARYLLAPDA